MNNQNKKVNASVSRSLGNVNEEQYCCLLDLAAQNPREAMILAANLLGSGDGSNYAAIACNMVAAIAYARLLETSEDERNAVFAHSQWEGYPPIKAHMLFVAFRLRYQAWRTKTNSYERARIHFRAACIAYRHGIELQHVRGYIEEHGIEKLYAWSQRPVNTETEGVAPETSDYPTGRLVLTDLSGQQIPSDPLNEPFDELDEKGDNNPLPVSAASPPGRPPRTPKYADDVPPACHLEVRLTVEQFNFALGDNGPQEFMLHCRRVPNGGSKWIRVDGNIV